MTKNFNDEISRFNPQFDFLLQYPNGNKLSSVFGKIYRYCQMGQGKCFATNERMADEINMRPATFRDMAKWLVGNGLLIQENKAEGKGQVPVYSINEFEMNLQARAFTETVKQENGWQKPSFQWVEEVQN